jgi:hypothetical protein
VDGVEDCLPGKTWNTLFVIYLHEEEGRSTSLIDIILRCWHLLSVEHVAPGRLFRYVTTTFSHNDQFVARQVIFLDSFGNHPF